MDMNTHFVVSLVVRLCLIGYGSFQDAFFAVKYTDVDYLVFTDASQYVYKGLSPFKRPTYRYTPAVAFLVLPNVLLHPVFGKVLFCIFDVFTSILIYRIQKNYGFSSQSCRTSAFLWMYNPLTIVISSRGNAESIMTFLTTLSVLLCQRDKPAFLGLVYGLSVHFKIYPCIYVLSFYFMVDNPVRETQGWKRTKCLMWPSQTKALFLSFSVLGFLVPTLSSFALYGEEYLEEALLYHLTRKDIRHNFSPYFYLLYLLEYPSTNSQVNHLVSTFAFLLQAALMAVTSWTFTRPQTLPACMFVQTFLFVTFNKVCTSQYFMWYLCQFCMTYPLLSSSLSKQLLMWLGGQGLWLLPAYLLEFRGENTFLFIFLASLMFFLVNVYLVCSFLKSVPLGSCMAKKE